MRRLQLLGVLMLGLWLSGCGHVLSREALREADPEIDFATIRTNPEPYRGTTLLLGGQIVDIQVSREGSTLEILRYRLDRYGYPTDVDERSGRFLVRTERFLDPSLYSAGQFVTLTGTLVGVETRELRRMDYDYPVFALREAYIWTTSPMADYWYPGYFDYPYRTFSPRHRFHDPFWRYDPFYDPYWYRYDPYWYRPPGRTIR